MIKTEILQKSIFALAAILLLITVGVDIYMAQPWGDNYAYQTVSDYFILALILVWACSPYIFYMLVSRGTASSRAWVIIRLLGAVVVCFYACFALINVGIFNPDAQGGLVILFMPIYQWMVICLLEVIGFAVSKI